jgi:DNA polymerase III sliding clamp (beta) subunit (PCNA family)
VARSDTLAMRFVTTVASLRDAIRTARRAISANPALVAYTGALFRATGERVYVTGSDGETTITARVEGSEIAAGQVLIAPGALGEFIDTFKPADRVDVALDDAGDVIVRVNDRPPYVFRALRATFPTPATSNQGLTAVDLSGLAASVSAVKHASGGTVQFVSTDTNCTLNTTDSYRLAQVRLPGAGFGARDGVALLGAVEELARHSLTHAGIDAKGRELRARGERVFISTRLVDEPFPAVDSVITQVPPARLQVPTVELAQALSRLGALAERTPLRLRVADGIMSCTVSNVEIGAGAEDVAVDGGSESFECAVQLGYLAEAVAAHAGADSLEIAHSTPLAPLHIRSTTQGRLEIATVVMPVRVNA